MKWNKLILLLILITLSIFLEYGSELFNKIPFKYEVPDNSGYEFDTTWKDPIWYFAHGILQLLSFIYIFILVDKKYIAVKFLSIAPISWWTTETYQKFCWLMEINDSRLYIDKSSVWQMSLVLFFALGSIYGLIRFKS